MHALTRLPYPVERSEDLGVLDKSHQGGRQLGSPVVAVPNQSGHSALIHQSEPETQIVSTALISLSETREAGDDQLGIRF